MLSTTKEVRSLLRNTFLEPNIRGFIGKEKNTPDLILYIRYNPFSSGCTLKFMKLFQTDLINFMCVAIPQVESSYYLFHTVLCWMNEWMSLHFTDEKTKTQRCWVVCPSEGTVTKTTSSDFKSDSVLIWILSWDLVSKHVSWSISRGNSHTFHEVRIWEYLRSLQSFLITYIDIN